MSHQHPRPPSGILRQLMLRLQPASAAPVALTSLAFAILAPAALAPAAAAQEDARGCAAVFPATAFDTSAAAGSVMVRGAGVTVEMTERFAGEFLQVVEWLEAEVSSLAGVEVCLFADEVDLDAEALGWYPGLPLRAVAFGQEGVVAASAWLPRYLSDAGAVGLIHIALWRASGGAYPQPFGDDVIDGIAAMTAKLHD